MMVNTSAGSSGARRTHPWRRRSGRARAGRAAATGGAIVVIGTSGRMRCLVWTRLWPSGLLVGVADGLGVQLRLGQRGGHRLLAGDGRAELLADVGAQILELRDVQELDPGVGHRLERRGRW